MESNQPTSEDQALIVLLVITVINQLLNKLAASLCSIYIVDRINITSN